MAYYPFHHYRPSVYTNMNRHLVSQVRRLPWSFRYTDRPSLPISRFHQSNENGHSVPANLFEYHNTSSLRKEVKDDPKVELMEKGLWKQFHSVVTEMIVTRSGRPLFPRLKVKISGLDKHAKYIVLLDIVVKDEFVYTYKDSRWKVIDTASCHPELQTYFYPHEDSPATGEEWMKRVVSFDNLKLTNQPFANYLYSVPNTMQMHQPRIHIVQTNDVRMLPHAPVRTYVFKETQFIAVTSYKNDKMRLLKIKYNPYAARFRKKEPPCDSTVLYKKTSDGSWHQLCQNCYFTTGEQNQIDMSGDLSNEEEEIEVCDGEPDIPDESYISTENGPSSSDLRRKKANQEQNSEKSSTCYLELEAGAERQFDNSKERYMGSPRKASDNDLLSKFERNQYQDFHCSLGDFSSRRYRVPNLNHNSANNTRHNPYYHEDLRKITPYSAYRDDKDSYEKRGKHQGVQVDTAIRICSRDSTDVPANGRGIQQIPIYPMYPILNTAKYPYIAAALPSNSRKTDNTSA